MPELADDDVKYCQGPDCQNPGKTIAVKICHHSDCQEGNKMNPLLLCDDCDQAIHVGQAVCHLRFQLPKNFKRTASIRSTNSDSGTEDDAEVKHFDKKNRGYASARRFFNINSVASSSKKKVAVKAKDPGCEFITIQFYRPGTEEIYDSEVIPALKGKSLKDSLMPLFERRGLTFETHSVCLKDSHTPLPLAFDIYPLGGNNLHVRAINDLKVDKRIIEIAKQSLAKEKEKDENEKRSGARKDQMLRSNVSQRGKKNISSYLGEDDAKFVYYDQGKGFQQRRAGMHEAPKLGDVTRTFNDILDYYRIYGFDGELGDNEQRIVDEQDDLFVEESWTKVIDCTQDMPKKLKDQQEAIWELLTTESSYIRKLNVITKLFLRCLECLQDKGHLLEIEKENLFGNITDIQQSNLFLWKQHLMPVIEEARLRKNVIKPSALFGFFEKFGDVCYPYLKYCMEEAKCLRYLKENNRNNEKFKAYLMWCEDHELCHRLKLTDLFVKPMQRLTKYPLLVKAIFKKTLNVDEKNLVSDMIQKTERFVNQVNSALRLRHEQKRIQGVIDRLDVYAPVEPVNDEVEKILADYSTIELDSNVPFLSSDERRCILMEGPLKIIEKQSRMDVYCFLFSDIFLITKAKRSNDKFKIIKQPFRLNKIVIHQLKESGGFLFLYRNEYGYLVNAFILQTTASDQEKWMKKIDIAKRRYNNARAGQGSTYEFFDDDSLSTFAQASPYHSPDPQRRLSWQHKISIVSSIDARPPIMVSDQQISDVRKPRSFSIEPRRVTSPHLDAGHLSESFDSSNKVARSASDQYRKPTIASSEDDTSSSTISRHKGSFWQSNRPTSMIIQAGEAEEFPHLLNKGRRSHSGSLLDSSPEDSESRRNESFRSTSSDTVLMKSDVIRDRILKRIKSSTSAPEVSQTKTSLEQQRPFLYDDSSFIYSPGPTHETVSVSSSSTSMSTAGGLSRDNSFNKKRYNEMSVLDERSHDEICSNRSTPNFLRHLEDNSALKDSLVDNRNDVRDIVQTVVIDQECQTEQQRGFVVECESQTDLCELKDDKLTQTYHNYQTQIDNIELTRERSTVDQTSQTDPHFNEFFPLSKSNDDKFESDLQETGVQCNLIGNFNTFDKNQFQHAIINVQRSTSFEESSDSLDVRRNSDTGLLKPCSTSPVTLRTCQSEKDLRQSIASPDVIHSRSLSAEGAFNNNIVSRNAKLSANTSRSPGMKALQSLSRSLEDSCHPMHKTKPIERDLKRLPSPPSITLRKAAILNSSPIMSRKDAKAIDQASTKEFASKFPSKRTTWHFDSLSELEKLESELLRGTKDDSSIENKDVKQTISEEAENLGKNKQKKKKTEEKKKKKKKKKDSELQSGVFSGPNIDKRKAQRYFLENSLMHEKPELV